MMDDIGITIITPIYNREDCIEKCILSSVSQNYVNYEHIIIDDGSNDKTKKIAKKYSKQYSNIKFISFANNNGPNYARNRGIEKANKEFVLFLDSDDILLPNSLKFISKVINNNEQFSCYLFLNSDKYKDANKK